MEFSNQVPNFHLSFLDEEQNERTDGRFVLMTDSDVDKLIETEESLLHLYSIEHYEKRHFSQQRRRFFLRFLETAASIE